MEPSKRLAIKTRDVTKRAKRAVTSVFVGMLVTGVHRRKASPGNSLGDKLRRAPDNRVRYLGIAKSIDSSVDRNDSQAPAAGAAARSGVSGTSGRACDI